MNYSNEKEGLRVTAAIREAIENDNDFYNRLLQRADRLMRKYFKGKEVYLTNEDIIYELIEKMIEGKRKWDGKIDIKAYMFNTIESIIYNHSKKEYRKTSIYQGYGEEEECTEIKEEVQEMKNEEGEISEAEKNEFYKMVEAEISDDDECIEYYLGIREGNFDYTKNKEAAEALKRTVDEIENIKKRFLRHCNNVYKNYYEK